MLPKVSQLLYLNVHSIDEEEAQQEMKARIAEMTEQYMAIEVPIIEKTGKMKRLFIGDELSAYFITDGGVKNYFTTSVLGFREEVIRQVILQKPDADKITREQRRNYLRVPAEQEISIKVSEQIHFIGMTNDVGGGGISFVCEGNITLEDNQAADCWLLLQFKNGKVEHVPFKGEIVRTKHMENDKQVVMLRFIEITDRDRQLIIRYCFERQLEYRKT